MQQINIIPDWAEKISELETDYNVLEYCAKALLDHRLVKHTPSDDPEEFDLLNDLIDALGLPYDYFPSDITKEKK